MMLFQMRISNTIKLFAINLSKLIFLAVIMKYTKLGKTGVELKALSRWIISFSQGVNFWDTAEMYAIPLLAKLIVNPKRF